MSGKDEEEGRVNKSGERLGGNEKEDMSYRLGECKTLWGSPE